MRKLTLALYLSGVLGSLSMPALADDVAVLDWQQALLQTNSAKQSMNELKNQLGSKQQQVKSLGQEVQQLQEKLQKNGDVMSDAERQNLVKQLRQKGGQYQQQRAELERARQQKEQQFLKAAKPKLDKAIDQVVKRHDVQVLVDRNSVIYAKDSLDLTQEVTNAFNSIK